MIIGTSGSSLLVIYTNLNMHFWVETGVHKIGLYKGKVSIYLPAHDFKHLIVFCALHFSKCVPTPTFSVKAVHSFRPLAALLLSLSSGIRLT